MSAFYDQASLVMVPSGYKDGKLYSQKPLSTSGELSFSRGSDIEATRVASNGYIEKAKVNLLLQSNTFNTTWTRPFTTLTSGQADKDGGTTAWKMEAVGTGSGRKIQQSVITSGVISFSLYVKAGTAPVVGLEVGGTGGFYNYFNVSTGTIESGVGSISKTIESVGNGFYRCTVIGNATAVSSVNIFVCDAAGATSVTDGAYIYIQDAQINYGLVAQEYQETTTAAVVTGITNDMPRLNYDPANPTCPSLLLEPSRTNLFEQSEYFGASYWAKNNGTITDNATTSPEGVVNAAAFTENSSTSTHFMQHAQVVASASTYYSASFFVKYNGRHFQIVGSTGSEGGGYVNFDLVNGVVGNSDQLTGKIEDYGNGWYRCTGTNISTSSATEIRLLPYLITSATSARAESYAGNGTSGVYIYGAQMEQANYQSSMVPTYGTSATRTADDMDTTFASAFATDGGATLFYEIDGTPPSGNNATGAHYAIYFSSNDYITYNRTAGGYHRVRINANSIANYVGVGVESIDAVKICVSVTASTATVYANGALVNSVSITGSWSSATSLSTVISDTIGSIPVKQLILFPTALTATQLAEITTL